MKAQANPLIWGAVSAILVSAFLMFNSLVGGEPSGNPVLDRPVSAAVISFFWGWVLGSFKNWLAKRWH